MRESRLRKSCWIEFLTSFCNQKPYFAFFSFWLDKMVMSQKEQMKLPNIRSWTKKLVRLKFLALVVTWNNISCFCVGTLWFPNDINLNVFVVLLGAMPFVFSIRSDVHTGCLIGKKVERYELRLSIFYASLTQLHYNDIHIIVRLINSFSKEHNTMARRNSYLLFSF